MAGAVRAEVGLAGTPFVLLVMGLLAAGVMATLFLSISAVADSYRLEDAQKKTADLTSRVEQLKADVAKGESPDVLYDEARKLGMVPAPDPARIKVNPDGSVSVTGSPVAATTTTTPPPTSTPPPSSAQPSNAAGTVHDRNVHDRTAASLWGRSLDARQPHRRRTSRHPAPCRRPRRTRATPVVRTQASPLAPRPASATIRPGSC